MVQGKLVPKIQRWIGKLDAQSGAWLPHLLAISGTSHRLPDLDWRLPSGIQNKQQKYVKNLFKSLEKISIYVLVQKVLHWLAHFL